MSVSVSPDALQAAWNAMRHRAAFLPWPAEFTQVMADPVRARLVRLEATGRTRSAQAPLAPQRKALPVPWRRPGVDLKSRAAGDWGD